MGTIAGWLLVALAAFMFVGYLNADVSGPAAFMALLITVLLPAAGGIMLIRRGGGVTGKRLGARREELRRETMQSELLRLAQQHQGRLTIVESVAALGITPDEAKEALDGLALRGIAEHEVTDSGVIVYVFHDVQRIDEKHRSKGLLE
jgi:hypothetical protein